MQSRLAITSILALALATGLVAAAARMEINAASGTSTTAQGTTVALSWAPEWLAKPLSRAIADATDPRERDKETGLPKGAAKGEVQKH